MSNNSEITRTGKVRDALAEALIRASRGELSSTDGKNMIGLANQITGSIAVEIKHQNMQKALGGSVTPLGMLSIGENQNGEVPGYMTDPAYNEASQ